MSRLAAAGRPGIEASALEIERGGPSYTADTLEQIHAIDPEDELTFIVGADTALTLPAWRRPETVLALARLAVAGRPGSDGSQVLDVLARIPSPAARGAAHAKPDVVFLSMAPTEASSSLARERLAAGEPVSDLLDPAVESYIAEHALYGASR
jgi:nicotinate-nucleotide adenylyltransferase